jgi:hypothetical protein
MKLYIQSIMLGLSLISFSAFASECDVKKLTEGIGDFNIPADFGQDIERFAGEKNDGKVDFKLDLTLIILISTLVEKLSDQVQDKYKIVQKNARALDEKDENCVLLAAVDGIAKRLKTVYPFDQSTAGKESKQLKLCAAILLNPRDEQQFGILKNFATQEAAAGSFGENLGLTPLLLAELVGNKYFVTHLSNFDTSKNGATRFIEEVIVEAEKMQKKPWIPSPTYRRLMIANPSEYLQDIKKFQKTALVNKEMQQIMAEEPAFARLIEVT